MRNHTIVTTPHETLSSALKDTHIGDVIALAELARRIGVKQVAAGNPDPELKREIARLGKAINEAKEVL